MPDTNILDAGYASMDSFFEFAPYIMLFLIPAITMKSFSDEYRNGTFELLSVLPIKKIVLSLNAYALRQLEFIKFLRNNTKMLLMILHLVYMKQQEEVKIKDIGIREKKQN